jgi:NAD(P)-dependent dehydrogenase (short-subunit alcohol dehydrogenase family)
MEKIWFITGASRGLGRSLTETVLAKGDKVAATVRNIDSLKNLVDLYPESILPLELDVTDYERVHLVIEAAIERFGRIDILVNNAGFGMIGAAEAFTDQQVRSQLETNLYAPIEITRGVLPYMRDKRSGRILQISSIGGRIGNAGISIYQAAKFGLAGFSESLSKEVRDLGIFVTSIEPGGFRTDWGGDSMSFAKAVEGYDIVDQRINYFKSGNFIPTGDPAKAAKVLYDLVYEPKPPVHLILGSDAIGMIKLADSERVAEMERWIDISLSTDHQDAIDFLSTETGKDFSRS